MSPGIRESLNFACMGKFATDLWIETSIDSFSLKLRSKRVSNNFEDHVDSV